MAEEASQRRHGAAHAARAQAFIAAARDEGAEIRRLQPRECFFIERAPQMLLRECEEARGVVSIGAQRVRTHAALMGERRQPFAFQSFGRSSHARIARSSARAKKARSAATSSPSKRRSSRAPSTESAAGPPIVRRNAARLR